MNMSGILNRLMDILPESVLCIKPNAHVVGDLEICRKQSLFPIWFFSY